MNDVALPGPDPWALPDLALGEFAPRFSAATRTNPHFHVSTIAGRYALLAFMPRDPARRAAALAAFQAMRPRFDDRNLTAFFVATEALLVYNLWAFGYDPNRKSEYTHGNHKLEMYWTVVPGILLILLALSQIPIWHKIKSTLPGEEVQVMEVSARQFEWRIRYPGADRMNDANLRILQIARPQLTEAQVSALRAQFERGHSTRMESLRAERERFQQVGQPAR